MKSGCLIAGIAGRFTYEPLLKMLLVPGGIFSFQEDAWSGIKFLTVHLARRALSKNLSMADQTRDQQSGSDYAARDEQGNQTNHGRTSFSTGSTTQGGSNHGQGSHDIGGSPYRQGSEGSHAENTEPLNGTTPVGDAVDTGTSFTGAVDATAGTGGSTVGDSYGRNNLPGNEADASGGVGRQPVNLQDDSRRNSGQADAESGKNVNQQSDKT